MTESVYLLDDKPVPWHQIIRESKKYGYGGANSGLLRTSEAAEVLRANGHTVSDRTKENVA